MYKLFLTIRYLRKRRIAHFAIAAVTLCVAMVLIVMSVMGGFLDSLKDKARGMLGDIVVDNHAYDGFPLYQEFIDEIVQWPEIVQATPVIFTYGLIHFADTEQTNVVQILGIRLEEVYEVNAFKDSLYYEKHYPGTTHLDEQRQPLLGIDAKRFESPTDSAVQLALPEPYQKALEQTRRAGVVDEDAEYTELSLYLRSRKLQHIPGVYDVAPSADGVARPVYTGDPFPGLIIGRDIVAVRQADGSYWRPNDYPRGCKVTLTILPHEDDPTPYKQAFRYADDSRTGIYDIDSQHVYCDFSLLQKLSWMDEAERADGSGKVPARCSQIQVKVTPGVDPYTLTGRMRDLYHGYLDDPRFRLDLREARLVERVNILTWEQSQARIIAPVEKERQLVTILFGIVSLVAVLLVLCILYMIVLQKTRDIGIVKSIGGSSAGVACIFLIYGAAVGIVGAALGSVLGYFFVCYINDVQNFLTDLNPAWQVWDRSVYAFDDIPSTVRAVDMVFVAVAAVVASTVGSLAAAWRAGAMQPVEALRYE